MPDKDISDEVLVATQGNTALVCVRGRGSFKVGPALKQFGAKSVEEGCTKIIVDMADCIAMDSTFMGVLAGLAMRLKKEREGAIVVMNLNSKTAALLETLGVDRLVESYQEGEDSEELKNHLATISPLPVDNLPAADRRFCLETMFEAHKDLVKASPDNLPKFKDVLEYLGRDLDRHEEN